MISRRGLLAGLGAALAAPAVVRAASLMKIAAPKSWMSPPLLRTHYLQYQAFLDKLTAPPVYITATEIKMREQAAINDLSNRLAAIDASIYGVGSTITFSPRHLNPMVR